jgi:hypothetical protein
LRPKSSSTEASPAEFADDRQAFETREEAVKLQYELLSILDSKASALLTFDAVALASLSIWLGYIPLNYMHLSLDLVFLAMLFSCVVLLTIIWLRWASDADDESRLNEIREVRTARYRLAWRLSLSGMTMIIIVSVVHTAGTALIATNHCSTTCRYFYSENVFGNLDYEK